MNFSELMNIAASNKAKAQAEASIKRYSTTFSAATKHPKSDAMSQAVQRFLAKKQQEEEQKGLEAQRKKEALLYLRSQNKKSTKNGKTAPAGTRDCDPSGKNPTVDEVTAKRTAENKFQEKQHDEETKEGDKNKLPSQSSRMTFNDLLKLASQKQHEPVKLPEVSKSDSRPLTQKQKDELYLKEQAKKQRLLKGQSAVSTVSTCSKGHSSQTSQAGAPKVNPAIKKDQAPGNGMQLHPNDQTNRQASQRGFPISKKTVDNMSSIKNNSTSNFKGQGNGTAQQLSSGSEKNYPPVVRTCKNGKGTASVPSPKIQNHDVETPNKQTDIHSNFSYQCATGKSEELAVDGPKVNSAPKDKPRPVTSNTMSIEAEKLDLKYKNSFRLFEGPLPEASNPPQAGNTVKRVANSENEKILGGKYPNERSALVKNVPANRFLSVKPKMTERSGTSSLKPPGSTSTGKRTVSKPFHINPYMDEPLQILEPGRKKEKQVKRRIESDDEDDDLKDFIDDEPCNGDVDYSKYIRDIFRCDLRKYVDDDDDDDIIETSYAEQMKEDARSARLGFLEDLEDIKKEKEEKKRQMMKKRRIY